MTDDFKNLPAISNPQPFPVSAKYSDTSTLTINPDNPELIDVLVDSFSGFQSVLDDIDGHLDGVHLSEETINKLAKAMQGGPSNEGSDSSFGGASGKKPSYDRVLTELESIYKQEAQEKKANSFDPKKGVDTALKGFSELGNNPLGFIENLFTGGLKGLVGLFSNPGKDELNEAKTIREERKQYLEELRKLYREEMQPVLEGITDASEAISVTEQSSEAESEPQTATEGDYISTDFQVYDDVYGDMESPPYPMLALPAPSGQSSPTETTGEVIENIFGSPEDAEDVSAVIHDEGTVEGGDSGGGNLTAEEAAAQDADTQMAKMVKNPESTPFGAFLDNQINDEDSQQAQAAAIGDSLGSVLGGLALFAGMAVLGEFLSAHSEVIDGFLRVGLQIFEAVAPSITAFLESFFAFGSIILNVLGEVLPPLLTTLTDIIVTYVPPLVGAITGTVVTVLNVITEIIKVLGDAVVNFIKDPGAFISKLVTGFVTGLVQALGNIFKVIKTLFKGGSANDNSPSTMSSAEGAYQGATPQTLPNVSIGTGNANIATGNSQVVYNNNVSNNFANMNPFSDMYLPGVA